MMLRIWRVGKRESGRAGERESFPVFSRPPISFLAGRWKDRHGDDRARQQAQDMQIVAALETIGWRSVLAVAVMYGADDGDLVRAPELQPAASSGGDELFEARRGAREAVR